jgi:hypothetical protein
MKSKINLMRGGFVNDLPKAKISDGNNVFGKAGNNGGEIQSVFGCHEEEIEVWERKKKEGE